MKDMTCFKVCCLGLEKSWVAKTSQTKVNTIFLLTLFFEKSIKSMGWLPDVIDHYETDSKVPLCFALVFFIRLWRLKETKSTRLAGLQ
jgi:hypothetical protein